MNLFLIYQRKHLSPTYGLGLIQYQQEFLASLLGFLVTVLVSLVTKVPPKENIDLLENVRYPELKEKSAQS